jgi:uncharacterized protein (TIGR03067 family)
VNVKILRQGKPADKCQGDFKMLPKSFVTLAMVLFITRSACCPAADERDGNQGTWQMVTAEIAGQKMPDAFAKSTRLVVQGDKYTVTVTSERTDQGAVHRTDKGIVKLNAAANPKQMDITGTDGPNKGKTFKAIYERHGDSLRVCYDLSGQSRPTEFKTKPGTPSFLATYKLTKP